MNHFRASCVRLACSFLFALGLAGTASSQWISETFQLSNGWNSIYLRGTPWPVDLDSQFASLPIRAVHRSYVQYDTAQFTGSSGDLPTRGTEWVVWYPSNSPYRVLTTLWNLSGNGAYQIECYTSCTWTVKGIPVIPARLWLPDNWNYVGLPVNPASEVTFVDYFRNAHNIDVSPDPAGGKVFRILPDGSQQDITAQTAILAMNPKEAYWIMTQGLSAYIGTISARATMGALRYPPNTTINSFTLRNEHGTSQQVSVKLVSSLAPPSGAPPRMGDVPLLYFEYDEESSQYEWHPLTVGSSLTKMLTSNEEWTVTLAVDRSALTPPTPTNATWQSVIEATDEAGTLIRVPVLAEYGSGNSYDALWPCGLWVGDVKLSKVSQVADGGALGPMPTASELTMRLIVHIGTNGQTRLLQQTVLEWAQSVVNGVTNSHYRLHTSDRNLLAGSEASRVSSVGFPYGLNALMSGNLETELNATYVIGYNDPANPFKHVYNPNHDNLSPSGQPLAEGMECYTISNRVRLVVSGFKELSSSASLWNPEEDLTGQYFHAIYGLRKEPILAEGSFTLRRVCRTGVLE
jgi:hypothetical protein